MEVNGDQYYKELTKSTISQGPSNYDPIRLVVLRHSTLAIPLPEKSKTLLSESICLRVSSHPNAFQVIAIDIVKTRHVHRVNLAKHGGDIYQ